MGSMRVGAAYHPGSFLHGRFCPDNRRESSSDSFSRKGSIQKGCWNIFFFLEGLSFFLLSAEGFDPKPTTEKWGLFTDCRLVERSLMEEGGKVSCGERGRWKDLLWGGK